MNLVARTLWRYGSFNIYSYTIPSNPGAEFLSLSKRAILISLGVYGFMLYCFDGSSKLGNHDRSSKLISGALFFILL